MDDGPAGYTGMLGWVFAAVTTVTTALASAVVKLYHKQIENYEKRIKNVEGRADECEKDRDHMRCMINTQEVRAVKQEARIELLETQISQFTNNAEG